MLRSNKCPVIWAIIQVDVMMLRSSATSGFSSWPSIGPEIWSLFCFMLSWIPVDNNEERFMPICSFKFIWGLHKVTWFDFFNIFFLSITEDNFPTVSALVIDSNLNYSFILKLLLEGKSSQNQTTEHIPGYLVWLLASAYSAHLDVFLSKTDIWKFLKGSSPACLQNWTVTGTVQSVWNLCSISWHQFLMHCILPTHLLDSFSSCCLQYDFTAKETLLIPVLTA